MLNCRKIEGSQYCQECGATNTQNIMGARLWNISGKQTGNIINNVKMFKVTIASVLLLEFKEIEGQEQKDT